MCTKYSNTYLKLEVEENKNSHKLPDLDQSSDGEAIDMTVNLPVVPKERYDLRILGAMRRIIRSVDVHSKKLSQHHGTTVPQLLCMLKIDEQGPMTLKELANEVFLNPSTLVGIVDRLVRQDVFVRERSVKDRRKVRISLTETGKLRLEQAPPLLQESLLDQLSKLNELEKSTIALSLEKLLSLLEPEDAVGEKEGLAPILETKDTLDEVNS